MYLRMGIWMLNAFIFEYGLHEIHSIKFNVVSADRLYLGETL